MPTDKKKSSYGLIFPLIWEAVFVICTLAVVLRDDRRHFGLTLYFMFVFYLGIVIYYRKEVSLSQFFKSFTGFKTFIVPVLITSAGMALARALSRFAAYNLFPGQQKIMMPLAYSSSIPGMIFLALTVMLLQPLAEELFFRKGIINLGDNRLLFVTILAAFVLEAVTRSYTPLGLLEAVLISVPLVVSYCATKNIYVPLFVHFIFNITVNMPDLVYDFMRLMLA